MHLKAVNIPAKINLKEINKHINYEQVYVSTSEIVFRPNPDQYLIVYGFGVIVLINIPPKTSTKLIKKFKNMAEPSPHEVEETHEIVNTEDLREIRIISLILAQSVNLEFFEQLTADMLDKTIVYSRALKKSGTYPTSEKELIKFIGFCATTRQEILSNLYIDGTIPTDAWEDQRLERLFNKLKDQYDLESRFRGLNLSLDSIKSSMEIMVDLVKHRKAMYAEWLIIGFFAFEVGVTIIEKLPILIKWLGY
jgi:required for meiotic nuclear division protein 1